MRIVEISVIDRGACCALLVKTIAEVGLLKIQSSKAAKDIGRLLSDNCFCNAS